MIKGDTVAGDYMIASSSTNTPRSVVSSMPHPTTSLLMFNHTTTPYSEFPLWKIKQLTAGIRI